jgi:CHAT domain-containing protein
LPIPEISRLQLRHAELAYLSACSTAQKAAEHSNESIHLASAFQLAGFRHVVASLWPLQDSIAASAAQEFHRKLPDTPTADNAALALHEVVKDLRDAHPGRPELWAALIHSGP